jgi:hypothetical protein
VVRKAWPLSGPSADLISTLLRIVHLAALATWVGAALVHAWRLLRARRRAPEIYLEVLRSGLALLRLRLVALGLAVVSGLLAMERLGWSPAWPRWFGVKLGLVLFLVIPLEAFQAWVALAWFGPGLEETMAPPFSRRLERALSMQDMLWALSSLLLGAAVPGLVWLSWARPF